ncbi:MAG: hypothetical protein QE263_08990 [Vampirovibrionales bacterium]|nr:hypothetical protein [Vampirovibrionales bacterium]
MSIAFSNRFRPLVVFSEAVSKLSTKEFRGYLKQIADSYQKSDRKIVVDKLGELDLRPGTNMLRIKSRFSRWLEGTQFWWNKNIAHFKQESISSYFNRMIQKTEGKKTPLFEELAKHHHNPKTFDAELVELYSRFGFKDFDMLTDMKKLTNEQVVQYDRQIKQLSSKYFGGDEGAINRLAGL